MDECTKPKVTFFLKAAPHNQELLQLGPCPITHKFLMAFYLLKEKNLIDLKVIPINLQHKPIPIEYKRLRVGNKLPVVSIRNDNALGMNESFYNSVAEETDEIEKLIQSFCCPEFDYQNPRSEFYLSCEIAKSFTALYVNFKKFLQNNNHSDPLKKSLESLNNFFSMNGCKYLFGNQLSFADCLLMPKLQHVIVGCKSLSNQDFPSKSLQFLCNYISVLHLSDAFILSCPRDEAIAEFYAEKCGKCLERRISITSPSRNSITTFLED